MFSNNDPSIQNIRPSNLTNAGRAADEVKKSKVPDDKFNKILDRGSEDEDKIKKGPRKKTTTDEPVESSETSESTEKEKPFSFGRLQSKKEQGDTSEGQQEGQMEALIQSGQLKDQAQTTKTKDSPFNLYSQFSDKENMTTKKKSTTDAPAVISSKGDENGVASLLTRNQSVASIVDSSGDVQQSTKSQDIQKLAAQMIDEMHTMSTQGQTDSVLKLQHPPILQGAILTLTAFENAPKEYNISLQILV